jgi:lysophospholipase L1-like esterase
MKKEWFEWISSWCEASTQNDLPRVLLIGDSITRGYQEQVRLLLKGKCYVDYLAVSYAIDTKMYNQLVKNFASDSRYDVIHFNHGLHGIHMTKRTYSSRMEKLLKKLSLNSKVVLAKTTFVYNEGNKTTHEKWNKRVEERNSVVDDLAKKYGFIIDDLYSVSVQIPTSLRANDGTHFQADGYAVLAQSVVESIEKVL